MGHSRGAAVDRSPVGDRRRWTRAHAATVAVANAVADARHPASAVAPPPVRPSSGLDISPSASHRALDGLLMGQKKALDWVIELPIEPTVAMGVHTKSADSNGAHDSNDADVRASPELVRTCESRRGSSYWMLPRACTARCWSLRLARCAGGGDLSSPRRSGPRPCRRSAAVGASLRTT